MDSIHLSSGMRKSFFYAIFIVLTFLFSVNCDVFGDVFSSVIHSDSLDGKLSNSIELTRGQQLKTKGLVTYEVDSSALLEGVKSVLRVKEGGQLLVGSYTDRIMSEFRVTSQTVVILEPGAVLQVDSGSSMVVESGGGLIIKEGAELDLFGANALVLEEEALASLSSDVDFCDNQSITLPPSGLHPLDTFSIIDIDLPDLIHVLDSNYINTLQGLVSTTPTGALTYQIPLTIPVGTAGMQPQLSVVYNSQNGMNGILGAGFGLSGLSSIRRVGKDFYHDGEKSGVSLDWGDRFAMDGQRLIRTGGNTTIGANGVYYDTESAGFSEIESFGNGYGYVGPQYFIVKTKAGSLWEYGTSEDSRMEFDYNSSTKVVNRWYLRKQTDATGNFIEYEYHTDEAWLN